MAGGTYEEREIKTILPSVLALIAKGIRAPRGPLSSPGVLCSAPGVRTPPHGNQPVRMDLNAVGAIIQSS